jgi:hypothetical protein
MTAIIEQAVPHLSFAHPTVWSLFLILSIPTFTCIPQSLFIMNPTVFTSTVPIAKDSALCCADSFSDLRMVKSRPNIQ